LANSLFVTEYANMLNVVGASGQAAQIPQEPPLAEYVLATAGVGATFNAQTKFIRVQAQVGPMSIAITTAGSAATTTQHRIALNQTEYLGVPNPASGAWKISAIDNT
jgi:hypothetical protein